MNLEYLSEGFELGADAGRGLGAVDEPLPELFQGKHFTGHFASHAPHVPVPAGADLPDDIEIVDRRYVRDQAGEVQVTLEGKRAGELVVQLMRADFHGQLAVVVVDARCCFSFAVLRTDGGLAETEHNRERQRQTANGTKTHTHPHTPTKKKM